MKKVLYLLHKLFIKDFDSKLKSASKTYSNIVSSTNGRISHFYNDRGEQIRGFSNTSFRTVRTNHPLIEKYGK